MEKQDVLDRAARTPDATDVNSLRNLGVIETMPLNSDASAVNPGMFMFSSCSFFQLNIVILD